MLCSLVATALLTAPDRIVVEMPTKGSVSLAVSQESTALSAAFVDPKYEWEFSYYAEGLAGGQVKFRVYAQSATSRAFIVPATRLLLRLWAESTARIGFDHPATYDGVVSVFLCDGGRPGAEQMFVRSRHPRDRFARYNAIYLYHLEGLTDPLEAVREICHEYGHAVLPAIGGFREPEEWANGALGERLFMRFLRASIAEGEGVSDDAFGLDANRLAPWLSQNGDRLAQRIATRRIDQAILAGNSSAAMDEYVGLMLFVHDLFPSLLGRAMRLAGGQTAIDALKGVVSAVNERQEWRLTIPAGYPSEVWVPVAGSVTWQGAAPLQSLGAWVKLRVTGPTVSGRRSS